MDRKATARETLRILEQGYYLYGDQRISIEEAHEKSVKESVLITPEEGAQLLEAYEEAAAQEMSSADAPWETSPPWRQPGSYLWRERRISPS